MVASRAAGTPITVTLNGGRVAINVASWPRRTDELTVNTCRRSTDGAVGRGLEVLGPMGLSRNQHRIAWIDLHVGKGGKPLLLCRHDFNHNLHSGDRPWAVAVLIACAINLAERLHARNVGNTYIEWRFDGHHRDDEHYKRFSNIAGLRPVSGSYPQPAGMRFLGTEPVKRGSKGRV